MREFRVYGGPGCGKTTYLSRQIVRACQRYGPSVLVCSFSNAAANELVTRDLPIPPQRVGTLHSLCRRAIGGAREIAETVPLLDEWNEGAGGTGGGLWVVPRSSRGGESGTERRREVATWLHYNILRNRLVPPDEWPTDISEFHHAWSAWKEENDLVDFTDLIEITHREQAPCPFEIAVLFADEVQDYSALEMSVVRAWGAEAEHFVLAGDDQQAIYGFRGASADALLVPELPDEQVTILQQSYRLPYEILAYATAYGDRMTRFMPKRIKPVEEGGDVLKVPATRKNPLAIVRVVHSELALARDRASADPDKCRGDVMIIAACDFMLHPIIAQLREEGVLFHNPYRKTNGLWNPTRGGLERLRKFLTPREDLRWRDVWPWFEHLDAKLTGLARNAKRLIKATCEDDPRAPVAPGDFETFAGIPLPDPDPGWFFAHILGTKAKLYSYAKRVLEAGGSEALHEPPHVVVGTIHSVKGGEADVVILCPDLSKQGFEEHGADPDTTRRLFYVGMTRARRRLLLLEPCGKHEVFPEAISYSDPAALAEIPF